MYFGLAVALATWYNEPQRKRDNRKGGSYGHTDFKDFDDYCNRIHIFRSCFGNPAS